MQTPLKLTCSVLALALAFAAPLAAQTGETTSPAGAATPREDAGAYLAARIAGAEGDFRAATYWYSRALRPDPENPALLEGAVVSAMAQGDFGLAAKHARVLDQTGSHLQPAALALIVDAAKRADYPAIRDLQQKGHKTGATLDGLIAAWTLAGDGQMTEALAEFDKLQPPVIGAYHKALAQAAAGDFEGADETLSSPAGRGTRSLRRAVLAHAEILSQLERNTEAVALLDEVFKPGFDPAIDTTRARLAAGEPLPWTIVQSPEQGMAEVFYTIVVALRGESDSVYGLILSNATAYLRPDHAEALLNSAALETSLGQPEVAAATYARVPTGAPEHYLAEIGRAETLLASDRSEAALEAMGTLAKSYPQLRLVQVAYGDMLRREERYEAATQAYDAAIALISTPERDDWRLYYSRAVCHERQKRWEAAESDFRKALELSPGQPQVLNYLGYSFLEMNQNLDEALSLIAEAVRVEPDNGAISDSYAWALFRLGRYAEALEPMEKASQLEPVDPVVTDHLGDVYWAVGRKREAEFQWRRALSYGPEEKDSKRIRRKLEVGLDKVLAEEGHAPLEAVNAAANDN